MKIKKWFFALNSDSNAIEEYQQYIKCAVNSALTNTTLEPHCLYDDIKGDVEIIKWLENKNINIHRLSSRFVKEMENKMSPDVLAIAKGTWLRLEIPELVKDKYEDEYVLYTDCDILFLDEFEFDGKCKFFAAAPEANITDKNWFNTGVMVMNINNLYETVNKFSDFIISYGIDKHIAFDQGAYNKFYKNKWDRLPPKFNWKPYWGINDKAKILHFHGVKADHIENIFKGNINDLPSILQDIYKRNPKAYKYYYNLNKKYY